MQTEQQQADADKHAEHRGDDRGADEDEHGDENEQNADDHLGIIIIDTHGGIGFETAQIGSVFPI